MSPGLERLIAAYNRVFWLLYYDEFEQHAAHQRTHLAATEEGFYTCAHALRSADAGVLNGIEDFFRDRGRDPAVYDDPGTPTAVAQALAERGYRIDHDQDEAWYTVDLTVGDATGDAHRWLRIDPSRVTLRVLEPSDASAFDEFIRVDATANELNADVTARLSDNLRTRTWPAARNILLLASVDGIPASTSSVGVYDGFAFHNEGGTLPAYRRCGLYSYLLEHRLRISREHGCATAVRTCSPSAHSGPASVRLGFSHRFTRRYHRLRAAAQGTNR